MKIFVKVKPRSSKGEITEVDEGKFIVSLTSPAEKNKANLELVKILSKYFKVSPNRIIIRAGLSNREKIIEVKDEI